MSHAEISVPVLGNARNARTLNFVTSLHKELLHIPAASGLDGLTTLMGLIRGTKKLGLSSCLSLGIIRLDLWCTFLWSV